VLYGGRGGAKSWGVAITLIIKALQKKRLILCTREIQRSIKDSVHKLLSDTINRMGLDPIFDIKKDYIQCKTGSKFIFKGLKHNITEVKSTEGIDICWTEEAQSISRDSWDILDPTVRKENSQIIITFNPDDENDPVYHEFITNGDLYGEDLTLININYNDNPFLSSVSRRKIELEKLYNYDKYLHIWKGEIKSVSDACIFKGKFTVHDFETPKDAEFFFGADWGFSQDPTVLIRCYEYDNELWIDYEAVGYGTKLKEIPQLFEFIPESRKNKIIADSSRPETIDFIKDKDFFIKPSKKGKDSIKEGIEFIKNFIKVNIHTRCKHTAYEFKSYSYKVDKHTNEILKIIIDKDNHCIDALRYSLEDLRKYNRRVKVPKVSAASLGL
jgi:phage terminase large subunit